MTRSSKPILQQVVGNLNTKLTVPGQQGGIQRIGEELVITADANDALRDIRWGTAKHIQVAAKKVIFTLPAVPVNEAHHYFFITVKNATSQDWLVRVVYPAQGADQGADNIIARRVTAEDNLLAAEGSADDHGSVGRPFTIYYTGVLSVESETNLVIGETPEVSFVWEIIAAPISAEQQGISAAVTEV